MIKKTCFQSTANKEEVFSGSAHIFPFRCLYADGGSLIGERIPWHWHSAFEIDYVAGSDTCFCFEGKSFEVTAGSAVFINSGAIHSYRPKIPKQCRIYALLFEPVLLSGEYHSDIFRRYIAPVMNGKTAAFPISADRQEDGELLSAIEKMIRLFAEEPEFYEILLRAELDAFWCELLKRIPTEEKQSGANRKDHFRMTQMLQYIHSHYHEPISVTEIANAAGIGKRECDRCFQRTIGRAPIAYVNDHRVQVAIQELMCSDKTVTEISEACGFSSVGYFGKVFRQYTGLSPVQYRNSQSQY